jgi:hypothetical protein
VEGRAGQQPDGLIRTDGIDETFRCGGRVSLRGL